jgi:hypothetical protein
LPAANTKPTLTAAAISTPLSVDRRTGSVLPMKRIAKA